MSRLGTKTKLVTCVASACALATLRCSLLVSTVGLANPPIEEAMDAALDGDANVGGEGGVPLPVHPVILTSVGTVATATGQSQQTHLVRATHAGRFWLFFVDSADPMSLRTSSSADFTTWKPEATLALPHPHGAEGRNFSVAYADIGGRDIVHLSMSFQVPGNARKHFHARATIDGAIVFDTPAELGSVGDDDSTLDPDSPATVVSRDGFVFDTSGWFREASAYGFDYAWRSKNADLTAAWTPGFDAPVRVGTDVVRNTNARTVLVDGSGAIHAFYEIGDVEPDPTNISQAVYTGSWSSQVPVFTPAPQHPNDWSVSATASGTMHAVRRVLAGGHQHVRKAGGASAWKAGAVIPTALAAAGAGLVLLANGERLRLVTVATDGALIASSYDGASWGAWSVIAPASPGRSFVSACATKAPDPAVVIWTDKSGEAYQIVGMPVPF